MLLKALFLGIFGSIVSFGAVIYDSGVTTISASPSLQTGRLSRSTANNGVGIPSDWSTPVVFPGIVNPGVPYYYESFAIPASPFTYLQISFYDVLGASNTFASAYANAYLPTGKGSNLGLDTNYLGYEGNSGTFFGNPRPFQVILPDPSTSNLVVVVNDTSLVGAGLNQPFQFVVEGFYDTNYNDTTPIIPEPASMLLSGTALTAAALAATARRKRAL